MVLAVAKCSVRLWGGRGPPRAHGRANTFLSRGRMTSSGRDPPLLCWQRSQSSLSLRGRVGGEGAAVGNKRKAC